MAAFYEASEVSGTQKITLAKDHTRKGSQESKMHQKFKL
jgi:hypothetical protein